MVAVGHSRENRLRRRLILAARRSYSRRPRLPLCEVVQLLPCPFLSSASLRRLHRRLLLAAKRCRTQSRTSSKRVQTTEFDHQSSSHGFGNCSSPASNVHYLGPFNLVCYYCGAILWPGEQLVQTKARPVLSSSLCCQSGRIKIPLLRETPQPLRALLTYNSGSKSRRFRENIRAYNSIFSFTSVGAEIDQEINKTPGPYVFRLNGQMHHLIGSLLPTDGQRPKFAQLYIYDTEHEVDNRLRAFNRGQDSGLDPGIVRDLLSMLDSHNQIVKAFRMARDSYREDQFQPLKLRIQGKRSRDSAQYSTPVYPEIAGLIVGDFGSGDGQRDIIVEHKAEGLKRISDLHPSYMAMQYPLLFPYGEDCFSVGIAYNSDSNINQIRRQNVTKREYYAYRVQQRFNEGQTLLMGGRLFQQFVVDVFSSVEQNRLEFIRNNQTKLRAEVYQGVRDAVYKGDTDAAVVGKRVILPSSFTGSPRYMVQNYQDAMAICRSLGPPDLFITFTCNAQWPEIYEALSLIPGQKAEDRPDLVSRVFKLKVEALVGDLKTGTFFTKSKAVVYTIEFQKRGLPHVHILAWLIRTSYYPTPKEVDSIISTEIPDPNDDPLGHEAVSKFMVHGPCGLANPKCPCMVDGRCSKYYPKGFQPETLVDEYGFVLYRRRDDGRTTIKNGIVMDNRFVVPHNRFMVVKYHAHINVEWCNKTMLIKYLFKYINKGPDRARVLLTRGSDDPQKCESVAIPNDEIRIYLDCRYLSPHEAIWRLFQFEIHFRVPSVERLPVHLPFMNVVYFRDHQDLSSVVNRLSSSKTMFTEWLRANEQHVDARALTYAEFPSKWVWNKKDKVWTRRNRGNKIGRIVYIHPTSGELYFLRLLLNTVRGPRSYKEIRTINGVVHQSYRSACEALGLLGDDREWDTALADASIWATASQLRDLFVTLLIHCEVSDPYRLFSHYWPRLAEDILHHLRKSMGMPNMRVSDNRLKDALLNELEKLLHRNCSSLSSFGLPLPRMSAGIGINNKLINEELAYDTCALMREHDQLLEGLNTEQKLIYDKVVEAVTGGQGKLFFVYGHGGTGKTYLWNTIISRIRSEGRIVLAVASSGIASVLLPGGRTAHSRFKIPLQVDGFSTCDIKKGTQLAQLIHEASLIVWDEAPMNHRNCFEALDRTLQDILRGPDSAFEPIPFGGKTVILGGDFRQVLPVIPGGTRAQAVDASISSSSLWKYFEICRLTNNMRLSFNPCSRTSEYAGWILRIGDGSEPAIQLDGELEPTWVKIPDDLLVSCENIPLASLVDFTYPEFRDRYSDPTYLRERAIITPKNDSVEVVNNLILGSLPTEEKVYLSYDILLEDSKDSAQASLHYPPEFLHSLSFNGVPNHELKLKIGVPVILLRNINQNAGLCNGTRLVVTKFMPSLLEATILNGSYEGERVYIPRITFHVTEKKWPFVLKRRQFPIRVCYCMTINKSQGQTLNRVGLYLPRPVFSHGQLYVALSRVTSRDGMRVLIEREVHEPIGYTRNVVYKEVFENII